MTALLFVGEAPGFHEDKEGCSWIGKAGQILSSFIKVAGFHQLADIYLSNACRCRPPQNASPKTGQVNLCRPYLQHDLALLSRAYERVVIVCCGRWGLEAVTRQSNLQGGFNKQGLTLQSLIAASTSKSWKGLIPPDDRPLPVFTTYHPAMLIPGRTLHDKSDRSPALALAVEDHFRLIHSHVTESSVPSFADLPIDIHINSPFRVEGWCELFDLDIETYGILAGREQTCFDPRRMEHIDGVPFGKQVVCLTLGYQPTEGNYKAYYYTWDHLHLIHRAFKRLNSTRSLVVLRGQNIKFDIQVLRAQTPDLRYYLDPRRVRLDDTLLLSFLAYEDRPERGLKTLTKLFGLYDYDQEAVTGTKSIATSPLDPALVQYNVVDTYNVHQMANHFFAAIKDLYGPDSPKFSSLCADMRNAVIWDTLLLQEAGIAFSAPKLQQLDADLLRRSRRLHTLLCRLGLTPTGTGSEKSIRQLYLTALDDAGMLEDRRTIYTDKTRKLSVGKENTALILATGNPGSRSYKLVKAYTTLIKINKLRSSYTRKLLHQPNEGILHPALYTVGVGLAYPYWFPMPSKFSKDSDDATGGTKQARFAAKHPAVQTLPKPIQSCMCSRFSGGRIVGYDLSQAELRFLAMLSSDPTMIQEYRAGVDRHAIASDEMFPNIAHDHPEWRRVYRQAGKRRNFLVVNRGGATRLQATLLGDTGVELPLYVCQRGIDLHDLRYPQVRRWQDAQLDLVRKHGHLTLPTGWSRYWGTGNSVNGKISEVADFPIQTITAQVVQSAQFEAHLHLLNANLRSVICNQVHDSLKVDVYPGEEAQVDEIMISCLTYPTLLSILADMWGPERMVPLVVDKES